MTRKKLVRNPDRIIAGVCSGIADYLNVDATVIRVIYVLLTFSTCFSGVIIYFILWLVMPEKYK